MQMKVVDGNQPCLLIRWDKEFALGILV